MKAVLLLLSAFSTVVAAAGAALARRRDAARKSEWLAARARILQAASAEPDAESALSAAAAALRELCCGPAGSAALLTISTPGAWDRERDARGQSPAAGCAYGEAWNEAWLAPAAPQLGVAAPSDAASDALHRLLTAAALRPPAAGDTDASSSASGGSARRFSSSDDTSLAFLRLAAARGEGRREHYSRVVTSEKAKGGITAFADWRVAAAAAAGAAGGFDAPARPRRMRATSGLLALPWDDTAFFLLVAQPAAGWCVEHPTPPTITHPSGLQLEQTGGNCGGISAILSCGRTRGKEGS